LIPHERRVAPPIIVPRRSIAGILNPAASRFSQRRKTFSARR
jgi:hypothetical protein